MNCPNCGKETLPGALFCTGCGGRLDTVEVNDGSNSEPAWSDELGKSFSETSDPVLDAEFEPAASLMEPADAIAEMPTAPAEQGYANAASVADAPAPSDKSETDPQNSASATANKKIKRLKYAKPLSTWSFVWREFVFMIPIINVIVLFVLAFGEGVNKNSRSFARSRLIYMLIAAIIIIASAVLVYIFSDSILDWLRTSFRQWYEAAQ